MAGRVDALYFFLLAVCDVLLAADRRPDRRSTRSGTAAASPDSVGARDPRRHGARDRPGRSIPLLITMVIFVWGASVFFAMSRPPDETLNIYVVGKQWMWKFQHLDGQREINELHVPVGRAGEADHDVRGRDPRRLRPGVPRQGGRAAGPLHQPLVPGDQAGRYHLFCAEYCGTRHSGMIGEVDRDGADRLPDLAERRRAGRIAGVGRREAVPGSGLQHLPSARRAGPRPGARGPVRQDRARCRAARRSSSTRPTSANRSCNPARRSSAGFQPIMPTFQGLVSEEQLLQLIEYVKSLQTQPRSATGGPSRATGTRRSHADVKKQ